MRPVLRPASDDKVPLAEAQCVSHQYFTGRRGATDRKRPYQTQSYADPRNILIRVRNVWTSTSLEECWYTENTNKESELLITSHAVDMGTYAITLY